MILLVGNGGTHLQTEYCLLGHFRLQKDVIMNHVKPLSVLVTRTAVTLPGIYLAVVTMYSQEIVMRIIILSLDAQQKCCAVNLKVHFPIHQLVELCLKMLLMLF